MLRVAAALGFGRGGLALVRGALVVFLLAACLIARLLVARLLAARLLVALLLLLLGRQPNVLDGPAADQPDKQSRRRYGDHAESADSRQEPCDHCFVNVQLEGGGRSCGAGRELTLP